MVSCFRVFVVFFPLFFAVGTVILSAFACAGSTSNKSPVNDIYLFKMNLQNLSVSEVYGLDVSLSSLNISNIITIGMWGYCKGEYDESVADSYRVEYCSTPKAMYVFNPIELLEQQLNSSLSLTSTEVDILNQVDVDVDVKLPNQVEDYIKTVKILSKVIFICTIIGVCAGFVSGVLTLFSFCSHCLSFLAAAFGLVSFLSLIISGGAATGGYELIKKYFNKEVETFGIESGLGNYYFYALIWASVAAALLLTLTNFFAICCGSTRSVRREVVIEKQPFMGYEEKSI